MERKIYKNLRLILTIAILFSALLCFVGSASAETIVSSTYPTTIEGWLIDPDPVSGTTRWAWGKNQIIAWDDYDDDGNPRMPDNVDIGYADNAPDYDQMHFIVANHPNPKLPNNEYPWLPDDTNIKDKWIKIKIRNTEGNYFDEELVYMDATAPPNPSVNAWSDSSKSQSLNEGTWYNNPAPYFEWQGYSVTDVAHFHVCFSKNDPDAVPFLEVSTLESEYQALLSTNPLNSGEYYFRMTTEDTAFSYEFSQPGNVSSPETCFVYKYDCAPPTAGISELPYDDDAKHLFKSTTFEVSWQGNDNNLSGIAAYTVEYGEGWAVDTWLSLYSGASNSCIFTGEDGKVYHFRVKAIDNAGNEGYFSLGNTYARINIGGPATPSNFTAIPGNEQINLSWNNPADQDFCNVIIVRKEGSQPTFTPVDETQYFVGATVGDSKVVYMGYAESKLETAMVGIENGITYYYAIFAYDSDIFYSDGAFASATPEETIPDTPLIAVNPAQFSFSANEGDPNPIDQMLTISNIGTGDLNWTVSKSFLNSWLKLDGGDSNVQGTNNGSIAVSVDISGMSEGTYNGNITVSGNADNSPQTIPVTLTIYSVGTALPPVISNISVSNLTENTARITWDTDMPSTSIVYYGTTTSYGNNEQDGTLKTSHSIDLTGLSPDTTYHYKIESANGDGVSSSSSDNAFITLEQPPEPPNITSINPLSGPIGCTVVITGTNFNPDVRILFENIEVESVIWESPNQLIVVVPVGLTEGSNSVKVINPDNTEGISFFSVTAAPVSDVSFNYPNPFNPNLGTTISFSLDEDTLTKVLIYNACRQLVWQETYQGTTGNSNYVFWNGRDLFGNSVPIGPYYYFVVADGKVLGRGEMAAYR